MKKVLALLVLFSLLIGCGHHQEKYSSDTKNQFKATCKIISANSIGTGVLLDTGYVITAGHVVDINDDGNLGYDELTCGLQFEGSADIESASVIFLGSSSGDESQDFAILSTEKHPSSNISLLSNSGWSDILVGEKVFTIGYAAGEDVNLTDGRIDIKEPTDKLSRATCSIIQGNSGGGVFLDNSLCGIMTQCFQYAVPAQLNLVIPVPNQDGSITPAFVEGQIYVFIPAPCWSRFVSAPRIREILLNNNLGFVLNKQYTSKLPVLVIGLIEILLIIALVFYGPIILGKTVRRM